MGELRRVDYSRGVGQMPVIRTSGVAIAAVVAVVVRIVPDSNAGASLQQRGYASTDPVRQSVVRGQREVTAHPLVHAQEHAIVGTRAAIVPGVHRTIFRTSESPRRIQQRQCASYVPTGPARRGTRPAGAHV